MLTMICSLRQTCSCGRCQVNVYRALFLHVRACLNCFVTATATKATRLSSCGWLAWMASRRRREPHVHVLHFLHVPPQWSSESMRGVEPQATRRYFHLGALLFSTRCLLHVRR